MIRRHVLPDSTFSLKKSESEARAQEREDNDAAQIHIALLKRFGGDHRDLIEFIHFIGMIVSGWAGMRGCKDSRTDEQRQSEGATMPKR